MGNSKRDGFYKRGKVWWTRDPFTGQRCSTRCTDIEAARRWRAARERIAADPVHAAAQTSRLGEWIGQWLTLKARTASAATMAVARQKLGHWVRIIGADAPLVTIDAPAVDRFVAQRRAEEVSDHTISKEVAHLLAVLRLAKRGRAYAGDLDTLRPPDLHAGYVPRKRALMRPELAALLSELEPHRGALVAVCVALGCRSGEAFRLLPTDIDWQRGTVLIRGSKTAGSRREVPILSLYRPLLERATEHLPLQPWGKHIRDIKAACRRAGIEECSPNDLRRTHSTLLIEAGVDRDVVRRLLGHTTTAMVDRVYGQPTTQALAILAEQRLHVADPLTRYTDVTVSERSDANTAKAPVAQRTEQRFPKPRRGDPETADNLRDGGKHAGLARASAGECAPVRRVAGTRTSQSLSAAAWSLVQTAARVLGGGK
jgi:integrase